MNFTTERPGAPHFVAGAWRPPVGGQEEPALLIDVGGVRFVLDPNR